MLLLKTAFHLTQLKRHLFKGEETPVNFRAEKIYGYGKSTGNGTSLRGIIFKDKEDFEPTNNFGHL